LIEERKRVLKWTKEFYSLENRIVNLDELDEEFRSQNNLRSIKEKHMLALNALNETYEKAFRDKGHGYEK